MKISDKFAREIWEKNGGGVVEKTKKDVLIGALGIGALVMMAISFVLIQLGFIAMFIIGIMDISGSFEGVFELTQTNSICFIVFGSLFGVLPILGGV